MSWRLYSRDTSGAEDVAFASTQRDAITEARKLLIRGRAIIRLESDDGEILEGKRLQDALVVRTDRPTMH